MNRTAIIIFLTIIIIGAAAGFWRWRTDPERQIRKTLTAMAELGSVPAGESAIEKALKTSELTEYFTAGAVIEWSSDTTVNADQWAGRENIKQRVLTAKNSAAYQISISDLMIDAKRRRSEARAEFNLTAREGSRTWSWLATARLVKVGRRWFVNRLTFQPVLRR